MQEKAVKCTQDNGGPVIVMWLRNLGPYSISDKKNRSSRDVSFGMGCHYTLSDRRGSLEIRRKLSSQHLWNNWTL